MSFNVCNKDILIGISNISENTIFHNKFSRFLVINIRKLLNEELDEYNYQTFFSKEMFLITLMSNTCSVTIVNRNRAVAYGQIALYSR